MWPPELSLRVLSNLNATDLFLASGVWKDLALDEVLWHSLCTSNWGYASIYKKLPLQLSTDSSGHSINSYRRLYLLLDEATVTFNADAFLGMNYLFANSLLENSPSEIAKFFYYSRRLKRSQIRLYIHSNSSILDHLVRLENFANIPLCAALRRYFGQVIGSSSSEVSNSDLDSNLHILIDKFAYRFCECNPGLGLNQNSVYILCYSLLLLSTDLSSPHIKNKMSKREFIRNVRHALDKMDDDLYGQLYDDVYLRGHVAFIAGTSKASNNNNGSLNNGSNNHLFIYVTHNQPSGNMVH